MQSKEYLQIRLYGKESLPALLYCPGIHGDWTLVSSFRAAIRERVRFVEFTYPRSLDWTLEDYAATVLSVVREHGVQQGWLLGESFGSQVVWAMLKQLQIDPGLFQVQGLVLAGGFVQHPAIWGVHLAQKIWNHTPLWCMQQFLRIYQFYARFRHRHAPETLASMAEFVARRTALDHQAVGCRFGLIAAHDPRPLASSMKIPVYYLSGALDPIVPWPWVRYWLQRNCPGYQGSRIIFPADHNVLGTAPRAAAKQILDWMRIEQSK